uniref:FH2 domain-containing protein n=1 Tax=Mola mola TaxID=94237 RepID=A0A3Q4B6J0_MOLML
HWDPSLNWDTIPSQRVLGKLNVWTSKRPQRDLVLDIRSMEELFSHIDKQASLHSSRIMGQKHCDGMDPFPQEPQVKLLLSFSGNLSVLPEADQFMVQLVKVPGYQERLKMMLLREEFFPFMEEVKNSVAVMIKAANELLDCDDLHSVIRLVLKAGNYMNAGGYSANAIGFRMTSLLKLADTKANKPGMNLMHYVAKQAEDIDAELLTFPCQLEHIGTASRLICKEEVIADFEKEVKKVKEVKLYSSRQPGLLQQMETFLLMADVESSLQELNTLSNTVAEYFCEDPTTFKLEECCSIFHLFCKRFHAAVQENRERELAEQRRRRSESMRITSKRRSTVSCTGSEPCLDSSGLESALNSFLSTVPEGLARCRKTRLPPVQGSPSELSSKTVERTGAAPFTKHEKRQPNLDKEDEQLDNEGEAEKMREITRKVLRYQKGQSSLSPKGDTVPPRSTPRPRTRDFFFAHNGDVGSPWTILSPFTCSQRDPLQQNRQAHRRRLSECSAGDDLDDGVWESDRANHLPNPSDRDGLVPPPSSSVSLPECPRQRAVSKGPVLRSVSVDETRQSPTSRFRLGNLFHRRNHIERQASTSGFISFFRRIGGRAKPNIVEDQHFKDSET